MAMPFFGGKERTREVDNQRSDDFRSTGSFNADGNDGRLRSAHEYAPCARTSAHALTTSWTFFLDTANVHGPLLTYPPEFFTRNVKWYTRHTMYARTRTHACTHAHLHVRTHARTRIPAHMHTRTHARARTHARTHARTRQCT